MIILSAIAADTGWHWMLERADALWSTPWPQPTFAGVATLAVWIGGMFVAAGMIGFVARRLKLAESVGPAAAQSGLAD
jgi:hypothetical protein